jgi:hypothetical protein
MEILDWPVADCRFIGESSALSMGQPLPPSGCFRTPLLASRCRH